MEQNNDFQKHAISLILQMDDYQDDNISELIIKLYGDKFKKDQITELENLILADLSFYFKQAHQNSCTDLQKYLGMDLYLDLPGKIKNHIRGMQEISNKLKNLDYIKKLLTISENKIDETISENKIDESNRGYCIIA